MSGGATQPVLSWSKGWMKIFATNPSTMLRTGSTNGTNFLTTNHRSLTTIFVGVLTRDGAQRWMKTRAQSA